MDSIETLGQNAPRPMDETFLIWLGIVIGALLLIFLLLKIIEGWQYEICDWRKDNKAGKTLLENLALASSKTLREEMELLRSGNFKYSRELSIKLYMAIYEELRRRENNQGNI